MTPESPLVTLVARWKRMDAAAAGEVLRTTTWSYLTGGLSPVIVPSEPAPEWPTEQGADAPLTAADRAALVARGLLTRDPRFAEQLRRLSSEPFSEDFSEFLHLLIEASAQAGATYATHLDGATDVPLSRVVRATAALLGVDLMPEPPTGRELAA